MSYRSEWQQLKRALASAGYETDAVFTEDLGPALDAFQAAERDYDHYQPSDPRAVQILTNTLRPAAREVIRIGSDYERAVRVSADEPDNPVLHNLKVAAQNADGWLMNQIRLAARY